MDEKQIQLDDAEYFKRIHGYIKRCCERGIEISDVDVIRSLVLIMDEINAIKETIKANQEKEKPHQKSLENFEQTKENVFITSEEFYEQVRLLHAQRDF